MCSSTLLLIDLFLLIIIFHTPLSITYYSTLNKTTLIKWGIEKKINCPLPVLLKIAD